MSEDVKLKIQKQAETIENNLSFIKENIGKLDSPIIIEFLGTPKSGKTTLVTNLQGLLEKAGIPVEKKRETAEYNPIEDKTIEEYNLWMIMELMKNLSQDTSSKDSKVIIYDRGILDRIPWLDTSVDDGSFPYEDARYFKGLYATKYMEKYEPLTYGFLTSPDISILRKGGPGRLVNQKTLTSFNGHFREAEPFFRRTSKKYTHIDTDMYQGNLKGFIMDVVEQVTTDTRELIEERLKKRKKEEGPDFSDK